MVSDDKQSSSLNNCNNDQLHDCTNYNSYWTRMSRGTIPQENNKESNKDTIALNSFSSLFSSLANADYNIKNQNEWEELNVSTGRNSSLLSSTTTARPITTPEHGYSTEMQPQLQNFSNDESIDNDDPIPKEPLQPYRMFIEMESERIARSSVAPKDTISKSFFGSLREAGHYNFTEIEISTFALQYRQTKFFGKQRCKSLKKWIGGLTNHFQYKWKQLSKTCKQRFRSSYETEKIHYRSQLIAWYQRHLNKKPTQDHMNIMFPERDILPNKKRRPTSNSSNISSPGTKKMKSNNSLSYNELEMNSNILSNESEITGLNGCVEASTTTCSSKTFIDYQSSLSNDAPTVFPCNQDISFPKSLQRRHLMIPDIVSMPDEFLQDDEFEYLIQKHKEAERQVITSIAYHQDKLLQKKAMLLQGQLYTSVMNEQPPLKIRKETSDYVLTKALSLCEDDGLDTKLFGCDVDSQNRSVFNDEEFVEPLLRSAYDQCGQSFMNACSKFQQIHPQTTGLPYRFRRIGPNSTSNFQHIHLNPKNRPYDFRKIQRVDSLVENSSFDPVVLSNNSTTEYKNTSSASSLSLKRPAAPMVTPISMKRPLFQFPTSYSLGNCDLNASDETPTSNFIVGPSNAFHSNMKPTTVVENNAKVSRHGKYSHDNIEFVKSRPITRTEKTAFWDLGQQELLPFACMDSNFDPTGSNCISYDVDHMVLASTGNSEELRNMKEEPKIMSQVKRTGSAHLSNKSDDESIISAGLSIFESALSPYSETSTQYFVDDQIL